MGSHKTSLSGGALLRSVLIAAPGIAGRVTKIFPVAVAAAELPYICYRRKALQGDAVKAHPSDDTVLMEVMVCAADYDESVALAEAARAALDGNTWDDGDTGLRAMRCTLVDASESFDADAYVQLLTFRIKIQ